MKTTVVKGPMEAQLTEKLKMAYQPTLMEVENESHMHSSGLGAESHFKVLIVSKQFEGQSKVQRQRMVFSTLAVEMKMIHALSLRLLTPEEMQSSNTAFVSPVCHSKKTN